MTPEEHKAIEAVKALQKISPLCIQGSKEKFILETYVPPKPSYPQAFMGEITTTFTSSDYVKLQSSTIINHIKQVKAMFYQGVQMMYDPPENRNEVDDILDECRKEVRINRMKDAT